MSLVIQNSVMKTENAAHSKNMLMVLVTHICVPYHCEVIGQSIWTPPLPDDRSPKNECCIKETKTGAACLLYISKIGMKTIVCTMIEWVGPRCPSPMKKSMSGRIETRKSRATLIFTSKSFEAAFPVRYPSARCPTANIVSSSVGEWDSYNIS